MKVIVKCVLFLIISTMGFAQKASIAFELNGRNVDSFPKNPFRKFVGEWTLKEDTWIQDWGSGTETIKIIGHHTISTPINTDNSLLSIIDGPQPNGHIFWSYNPNAQEVFHLSSFGTVRAGNGKGTVDEQGNVALKLYFEGEPKGTYRKYRYTWINENEYHMKSIQFSANHEPTGLFYEGTFIRIKK